MIYLLLIEINNKWWKKVKMVFDFIVFCSHFLNKTKSSVKNTFNSNFENIFKEKIILFSKFSKIWKRMVNILFRYGHNISSIVFFFYFYYCCVVVALICKHTIFIIVITHYYHYFTNVTNTLLCWSSLTKNID